MPGRFQQESPDRKHKVTIGSADDKKRKEARTFVSQQDNKGNKWTVVYDDKTKIVKEVTRKKK